MSTGRPLVLGSVLDGRTTPVGKSMIVSCDMARSSFVRAERKTRMFHYLARNVFFRDRTGVSPRDTGNPGISLLKAYVSFGSQAESRQVQPL